MSVSSDGGGGDGSDGSLICNLHHGFPETATIFQELLPLKDRVSLSSDGGGGSFCLRARDWEH